MKHNSDSKMTVVGSLQNHFLIAMPSLETDYFKKSVTYIIEHNKDGAMGIVINQPSTMTYRQLVDKMNLEATIEDKISEKIVMCGGPVKTDRGFVLHSKQEGWKSSIRLSDNIMVTTSKDIIGSLGDGSGPDKELVALGYAGWSAGQLEQEIQDNAWLTIEASEDILFETPIHRKWELALNKLGVDTWQLTQQSGNA